MITKGIEAWALRGSRGSLSRGCFSGKGIGVLGTEKRLSEGNTWAVFIRPGLRNQHGHWNKRTDCKSYDLWTVQYPHLPLICYDAMSPDMRPIFEPLTSMPHEAICIRDPVIYRFYPDHRTQAPRSETAYLSDELARHGLSDIFCLAITKTCVAEENAHSNDKNSLLTTSADQSIRALSEL